MNSMSADDQVSQVSTIEKMINEYVPDQTAILQDQYKTMVEANNIAVSNAKASVTAQNDSINAWNSIANSISGLKDFASDYRNGLNTDSASGNFYSTFSMLQGAIGSNNSDLVSSLASDAQGYASTYLGTLSSSSLAYDDRHNANKLLSTLESLPKMEEKTLVDVDASVNAVSSNIGSFEEEFSYELDALKNEQIKWYQTMDFTLTRTETSLSEQLANLTSEVTALKTELANVSNNTASTASYAQSIADNTEKSLIEVA
jgi:hypothetical protein